MSSRLPPKQLTSIPYRNLIKPKVVRINSNTENYPETVSDLSSRLQDSYKSFSSKSSAFWPFTKSFEENNFLSHIISEELQAPNQSICNGEFDSDPTYKLFKSLKKAEGQTSFDKNEIVLAKCVNEPLWPAKITHIEQIPGWLPDGYVYHLKFINQRNTCIIDKGSLIKFNQKSMQQLRKATQNRKLIRALKLAQKYFNQQLNDSQFEASEQKILDKLQVQVKNSQVKFNLVETPQVQLSLSSFENLSSRENPDEQALKNIKVNTGGFFTTTKNIFKPHVFKKDQINHGQSYQISSSVIQENQSIRRKAIEAQSKQSNTFKPIIIVKGDTLEIQLNPIRQSKDSYAKEIQLSSQSQQTQNVEVKQTEDRNTKAKEYNIRVLQRPKPMNLVVQTPRLPPEYYLDKVILKLNQDEKPKNNSNIKSNQNSKADLDETIMEQKNLSKDVVYQQDQKAIKIVRKVLKPKTAQSQTALPINFHIKTIKKILTYLCQIGLQGESQIISQKRKKQQQILQFLSIPLKFIIKQNNYIEYDKLLKASIQIIQNSNENGQVSQFALNLEQKLSVIYNTLKMQNGDNYLIRRLKKRASSTLQGLLGSKAQEKNFNHKRKELIVLCSENECENEEETSICPRQIKQIDLWSSSK